MPILIIDDQLNMFYDIANSLSEEFTVKHTLIYVPSHNYAVESIILDQPSLLIINADMNGIDVVDFIRLFEHKKLKIVLVSNTDRFAIKALKTGLVSNYFLKPYSIDELKSEIIKTFCK